LIDLNSGDLKTESNLKIKARLTFTNAAKDTLTFTGGIPIAENSLVDKQVISVDIGGVIRSFTLDAKGRAKTGSDSLKLRVKTANNVVSAQIAKFNIKVSNADFDTLLADEGLTGNSDLKHVKRQIPSYIFYVQYVYRALVIVDYSAKVRKTGVAK